MPKSCVLILLDGLGDRAYASLGHRTPLQAARTPWLDAIAARGANGLFHASTLGQALPSENAHFAIFGYELSGFPGRGALEALGAGVELHPDDVAVLAHFVSLDQVDGVLRLVEDLPKATAEEIAILRAAANAPGAQRIFPDVEISFHPTKGLFGVLRLRGELSRYVTDSNPMRNGRLLSAILPWEAHAADPTAQRCAAALRAYLLHMHRTLPELPFNRERAARGDLVLNGLVTQRAGRLERVTPFPQRFGMRGVSISSGVVFKGLAAYLGMEHVAPQETGDVEADFVEVLQLANALKDEFGYIHAHTKAPDEAAHTKDPKEKVRVLEALDRAIGQTVGPLIEDPEVLLVITSDHSTPSGGPLVHSGEPVPLIFCGEGVRRDKVEHFDEISAAAGCLSLVRGVELMQLVLNGLDRAKLAGIRDTPEECEFWPGEYAGFLAR
jgi:2,3-bisphosphoglycerate-independent phosphoglycerate mutase